MAKLRLLTTRLAFLVLGLLLTPHMGWAQIKLYLKDGSYQLVKSYEVKADRVRYYSIERSDWEEIPRTLVDFEATKRAQEEEKASQKKELDEVREIEKQRFDRPEQTGFEIAPGIRLPQEEGVFAFDGTRVIRMAQSTAEVVTDKKRKALLMAMPAPLLKSRSLVTLAGEKAAVRISVPQPTFYIQSADGLGERLLLIAVKSGREARVVEKIEGAAGGIGKPAEARDEVVVERKQAAPGIYMLKPIKELSAGEYALGELADQKLNLLVWDFGVDATGWKVTEPH